MYLGQLLQGDVQLVLHVLHLLLKIADLENIQNWSNIPHVGQIFVKYSSYCSNICQIFLKLVKYWLDISQIFLSKALTDSSVFSARPVAALNSASS